jgi:hypothetical protein
MLLGIIGAGVPPAWNTQNRNRTTFRRPFRRWLGVARDWRPRQKVNCRALRPDSLAQCQRTQPAWFFTDLDETRFNDKVAPYVVLGGKESRVRFRLSQKNSSLCEALNPGTVVARVNHDPICEAICGNGLHGLRPKYRICSGI